jgi:Protein of unknown function (DUF1524)
MPQNRLRLILEELEFAARNRFNINGALQEGLSIEHIMPQSWMAFWPLQSGALAPADLMTGVDADMRAEIDRRNAVVHTLPNLTLLTPPANSQVGNSDFVTKKTRLMDSLLKTNITIASEPNWHEDAMRRRAAALTSLATRLWPSPGHKAASNSDFAEPQVFPTDIPSPSPLSAPTS